MDELQKNLLQWTKLDKELKELNKKCSEIRRKKDTLQSKICPAIQAEQLEDNIFSIPSLETQVSFKEHKTSESLSYKFLEDKFTKYFNSFEDTQKLLQYLKDNRKNETNYILKSTPIN